MKDRNQAAAPKIYFELLGWLRPDLAANGASHVRFRPSGPTGRARSLELSRVFFMLNKLYEFVVNLGPVL
jgi:hypothetical protein